MNSKHVYKCCRFIPPTDQLRMTVPSSHTYPNPGLLASGVKKSSHSDRDSATPAKTERKKSLALTYGLSKWTCHCRLPVAFCDFQ